MSRTVGEVVVDLLVRQNEVPEEANRASDALSGLASVIGAIDRVTASVDRLERHLERLGDMVVRPRVDIQTDGGGVGGAGATTAGAAAATAAAEAAASGAAAAESAASSAAQAANSAAASAQASATQVTDQTTIMANRVQSGTVRALRGFQQFGIGADMALRRTAARMEQHRNSILASIDYMTNRTTQSMGIINRIGDANPFRAFDRGLLRVTDGLERLVQRSTPAALALQRLGRNASMYDLVREIQAIQKGLTRIAAIQLGSGLVFALSTWGMINVSNNIDGRLIPAFEELKKVWTEAIAPFVHSWTTVAVKIMGVAEAIGQLWANFSKTNPELSKLVGWVLYLIPLFTAILAPLTLAIGYFAGMQAAFAALWSIIGPFVIGFASVIGTATLVAAAVVGVVYAINQMWEKSEGFRNAVKSIWADIKSAVSDAIEPLMPLWERLKNAFQSVLDKFTGGEGATAVTWQNIGNIIGKVIRFIADVTIPIFKAALDGLVFAIKLVLEIITPVIEGMAWLWKHYGDEIGAALLLLVALIGQAFANIGTIITNKMNAVVTFLSSIWEAIKAGFGAFVALFNGDVEGFLNGVKSMFSNILNAIKAFFELSFLGDILTLLTKFGPTLLTKGKEAFNYLVEGAGDMMGDALESVKTGLKNVVDYIKGLGPTFLAAGEGLINMMKQGIENAASAVISKVKEIAGSIRDMLPFSPAKEGPLSDLDKLDFGGPIADSLAKALPTVQTAMTALLGTSKAAGMAEFATAPASAGAAAAPTSGGMPPIVINIGHSLDYVNAQKLAEVINQQLGNMMTGRGGIANYGTA